jgi:glycosyltransferase involved in cell wall biosynthesis
LSSTKPYCVLQILPALDSGGAERSCLEIVDALRKNGHRALVACAPGGRLVAHARELGAEMFSLDLRRKTPLALFKIPTLRRLLLQEKIDIVHARSRLPAWVTCLALQTIPRVSRPYFVTTVHGLNSVNSYSAIMLRGDRVIAVSKATERFLRTHYPQVSQEKIATISRGIDPAELPFGYIADAAWRARFFAEFPALAGRRLLLLPARGTRLKGHLEAIRALAGLRQSGINAALALVGVEQTGSTDYAAEINALTHDLAMQEYVVTTTPRSDVKQIMSVSDVVLQLSNRPESFGRIVAEALSLGKPVVGFAHGGVADLLHEFYPQGAVAAGNQHELLTRLLAVLRDPGSVVHRENLPSLRQMQEQTLAVYQALMQNERG